jgi:hypothetical protein
MPFVWISSKNPASAIQGEYRHREMGNGEETMSLCQMSYFKKRGFLPIYSLFSSEINPKHAQGQKTLRQM